MDENEQNFDFEGNESWMLLALLAMIGSMSNPEPPDDIPQCCIPYASDGRGFMQADKITLDEFTIEQMRAAAMNKKETDKLRLDSMYGDCMHKENDEDAKDKDIDYYKRELEKIKKEIERYNDEYIKEHEPDGYRGLYGRSWDV